MDVYITNIFVIMYVVDVPLEELVLNYSYCG